MGYTPTTRLLLVIVTLSVTISGSTILVYLTYGQRQAIEFHTIAWGTGFGYNQGKDNLVINNRTTWASIWNEGFGNRSLPEIDFDNTTVLAVFAGREPSAGYTINITTVSRIGTNVSVQVTLMVPGRNCLAATMITAPYHIVSVPKITSFAKFNSQMSERIC